jgi:hypothetical protein
VSLIGHFRFAIEESEQHRELFLVFIKVRVHLTWNVASINIMDWSFVLGGLSFRMEE